MRRKFLLFFALSLFAFGPMLSGPYVYDDTVVIPPNEFLKSTAGLKSIFRGRIDSNGAMDGTYRPLLLSAISVIGRPTEFRPFPLRVLSVLLHSTCALLLFSLFRNVFSLGPGAAFFSTLIFLLHPIQSTSIGMIWKQSDLWVGLLTLASLLCLWKSTMTEKRRWLLLGFLFFVLCFGFKESAVMIPLYWLAAETLLPRRGRPLRLLVAGAGLAISMGYYFNIHQWIVGREDPFQYTQLTRWHYFKVQLTLIPVYLRALCNPGLLTIDRGVDYGTVPSTTFKIIVSILIATSISMTGYFFRRNRRLLVAMAMFTLWMIPTSTFQTLALTYDESRLYLALGFAALASMILLEGLRRRMHVRPQVRQALIYGTASILVLGVWYQSPRWQSESRFWQSALEADPRSSRAAYHLGVFAENDKAYDEAEAFYRKALELAPSMYNARQSLGVVLGRKGDLKGAAEQFRELLKAPAKWAATGHYLLGLDSIYRKEFAGARSHFSEARRLFPKSYLAEKGEAIALTEEGRREEAILAWKRYLQLEDLSSDERKYSEKELSSLSARP